MQSFKTSLIFILSLIMRIWFTPKLDYGVDQRAIFELGKNFYETGIIPADGPKLVYTGESIPGGFQAIMSGLPLFFSQGDPVGLQIWVAILNWLAMLMLFFWLRVKVKSEQQTVLAMFLAFSPWSLLFSPAWNPSFLPIFAVPFFWILERTMMKEFSLSAKRRNSEAYLLGIISILCLQLHLSAVLLAIAILLALPFIRDRLQFLISSFIGVLTGAIFLIPWLLKKIQGEASVPTGVVGLHLENFADIPKAFFRYVSFSTAEVSRFISPQGHGVSGMLEVLKATPFLYLPALISYLGSLILVFIFLRYWFSLRKKLSDGFSRMQFLLPILMTLTFLFSIKGASAHTFWILMPLSFYSMVSALNEKQNIFLTWIYLLSSILFVVFGYTSSH